MRNRVLGTNMLATVATVLLIVGTAIGRQVPNADSTNPAKRFRWPNGRRAAVSLSFDDARVSQIRSEEHTSELQSHSDLVCRLLLEKKKCFPAFLQRADSRGGPERAQS